MQWLAALYGFVPLGLFVSSQNLPLRKNEVQDISEG